MRLQRSPRIARTPHNPFFPCSALLALGMKPPKPMSSRKKPKPKKAAEQPSVSPKRQRSPKVSSTATSEIDDEIDADSELVATRYSISAYGADFPVDGLVKRMKQGDIVVPLFDPNVSAGADSPGFQRNFVWTKRQSDRFVESLLFGFPVPGIFLFKDADNRLLVVDGQQRLTTLQAFCDGVLEGKEYRLTEVHAEWRDKRYTDLSASDRRRLDDTIIHATVIRQEEPDTDLNSVYLIFERLNTGGTALTPQQIRVALYRGPFVNLIRTLNDSDDWRSLVGKKSKSLKDQELILRMFALLHNRSSYQRPMKEFLNKFLSEHRNFGKSLTAERLTSLFNETLAAIRTTIGDRAFRLESLVNAALADAVWVGVAERLRTQGPIAQTSKAKIKSAYERLLAQEEFQTSVRRATANEDSVDTRLQLAIKAFSRA